MKESRVRELFHIVGEAKELVADPEGRRVHVLTRLAGLVHARAAITCRLADPPPHGTGTPSDGLGVGWTSDEEQRTVMMILMAKGLAFDPLNAAHFAAVARSERPIVTLRRSDVLSVNEWYGSEYFSKVRRPHFMDDGLYSLRDPGPGKPLEGVSFHRSKGDGQFTAEDATLIELAHEACAHALSPPPPKKKLSRRERETFALLVRGCVEKEIAAELGVTYHTAHQYVRSLYRHYGVQSRAELVAQYFGFRK